MGEFHVNAPFAELERAFRTVQRWKWGRQSMPILESVLISESGVLARTDLELTVRAEFVNAALDCHRGEIVGVDAIAWQFL